MKRGIHMFSFRSIIQLVYKATKICYYSGNRCVAKMLGDAAKYYPAEIVAPVRVTPEYDLPSLSAGLCRWLYC